MDAVAGRRRISPILLIVIALLASILVAWLAGAFDSWRGKRAQGASSLYAGVIDVCDKPKPIPPGYDYPQKPGVVDGWVKQGNVVRAREHGWYLWAALNTSDAAGPVWLSWCTETQAFAAAGTAASAAVGAAAERLLSFAAARARNKGTPQDGELPIKFSVTPSYALPPFIAANPTYLAHHCIIPPSGGFGAQLNNGPSFQSNGDIMVAGVVYNDAAFDLIRNNQLYDGRHLQSMLPPVNGQAPNPPQLPRTSIVLKPMLWPVPASGYSMLPMWDDAIDSGSYTGFEIQSQWLRAAAVTANPQSGVTSFTGSMLYDVTLDGEALGPNTYTGTVHGIDEFYAIQPDVAALDPCDKAILDASAYWAYQDKDGFQQGDYLVLIAMHIMTKEQADWTFQSVWWSDNADVPGPNWANRPARLAAGVWQNYLMASTYGFRGPPAPDGRWQWPIAFNPFIELAAGHPVRTNCINCHHRAAVPGIADPSNLPPWPTASYEAAPSSTALNAPDALDVYALTDPIFTGLLQVDSLWSISDRVTVTRLPADAAAAPPAGKGGGAKRSR
jgi:hypothetical protein